MKLNEKIVDIKENSLDSEVLSVLLLDRTTGKNILWATDDYISLGEGYAFSKPITLELITGEKGTVIKPRVEKDKEAQVQRSKEKAEVFTPSWICNVQNNLVDDAWFGKHSNRFNKEIGTTWQSTYTRHNPDDRRDRIKFPRTEGRTWQDYVLADRLEISCGEAPYLTSRYDTVTGKFIKPKNRIGLLDRKLRVIGENTSGTAEWLEWAEKALQSTYGFEWQGDNILLARENLLLAVAEAFCERFSEEVGKEYLIRFAKIISWNLWQMDGIKFVIPGSCHPVEKVQLSLFEETVSKAECPGCKCGDKFRHTGTYAVIRDWKEQKDLRFVDLTEEEKPDGKI